MLLLRFNAADSFVIPVSTMKFTLRSKLVRSYWTGLRQTTLRIPMTKFRNLKLQFDKCTLFIQISTHNVHPYDHLY